MNKYGEIHNGLYDEVGLKFLFLFLYLNIILNSVNFQIVFKNSIAKNMNYIRGCLLNIESYLYCATPVMIISIIFLMYLNYMYKL